MPIDRPWWMEPDSVRSILGLYTVLAGLALVGIVWALRGSPDAERLAGSLIGLIGIVLGYYFGSRGSDEAKHAAAVATVEAATLRAAGAEGEQADAALQQLRGEYLALVKLLEDDPVLRQKFDERGRGME